MNNETKEVIEELKNIGTLLGWEQNKSIRTAITALERLDKVKFVTEKYIKQWCSETGWNAEGSITHFCKDNGTFIESEKRCRWTNGIVTTNKDFTKSEFEELQKETDPKGYLGWHPAKEEE